MPRSAQKPSSLKTDISKAKDGEELPPKSSPIALEGIDLSSFAGDLSTNLTSLPTLPSSPPHSPPRHNRDTSRKLMVNLKSRTGSEPQPRERSQMRQAKDDEEYRPGSSSMSKIYHLRKNPGSTPELSLVGSAENVRRQSSDDKPPPLPIRPQLSPHHSEDSVSTKRKEKGFRNPLTRSKSIRRDSNAKSSKPNGRPVVEQPPNTAPINTEWQNSSEMLRAKKEKRGKSAERAASEASDNRSQERLPKARDQNKFMTGGMNAISKAKTGGNALFNRLGKIGRSSSSHEREVQVPDSEYVLKVINLPLVEQARITRISKNLGKCKDKTEFWMPSLPWRCIDYLNLNCESEGLYRVPGSGPQVKHWQRRFDQQLDVDLLDEQELYDPNNIGSLLKSWLRDLPDDIFPADKQKELQQKLADKDPEYSRPGRPVPQELRDTLSELSPFNYYLLFAVTCHLSLLLSHAETNRMDLHNLNICIGPCLRMDRWLFNYLVGDWRHCWQGCYTEKAYLEAEMAHENGVTMDPALETNSRPTTNQTDYSRDDDVTPTAEEPPPPSSGSNISSQPSRNGSHYSDARSVLPREMSPSGLSQSRTNNNENAMPESYRPTGSPPLLNGKTADQRSRGAGAGMAHRPKTAERPKTSDGKNKGYGEGSGVGSGGAVGRDGAREDSVATSTASTPKLTVRQHSRSQSDLPMTPTKVNGDGFGFGER